MSDICTLHRGSAPLLISLPHDGTALPPGLAERLRPEARQVPDTDWHVSRLYAFATELGASILHPRHSRYVIDLNRSRQDTALYPGQNTTGLVPLHRFTGDPLYLEGQMPSAAEVAERVAIYWQPYHDTLAGELERLRSRHGRVVLWEGHSIRGEVPWLFEGALPDLNLGTVDGASCRPALQGALEATLAAQQDHSWVANGRFKGGYITRHYGRPQDGVDAVQLELAQRTYMDEDSFEYLPERAEALQRLLRRLLERCLAA